MNTYLWDFGDGGTSTEQNPYHLYQEPGSYSVTLTITDEEGNSTTTTKENYIKAKGFVAEIWYYVSFNAANGIDPVAQPPTSHTRIQDFVISTDASGTYISSPTWAYYDPVWWNEPYPTLIENYLEMKIVCRNKVNGDDCLVYIGLYDGWTYGWDFGTYYDSDTNSARMGVWDVTGGSGSRILESLPYPTSFWNTPREYKVIADTVNATFYIDGVAYGTFPSFLPRGDLDAIDYASLTCANGEKIYSFEIIGGTP